MRRLATTLLLTIFAVALPLSATPVNGQLSFSGAATVGSTFLDLLCLYHTSCPANYGDFTVLPTPASTGDFATTTPPAPLNYGFIHNINQTTTPINQAFNLPNFLLFDLNPDIAFDLTYLFSGPGVPCPANGCTPFPIPGLVSPTNPEGRSPVVLAQVNQGVSATFKVLANARRISTGEITPYSGTFSAVFNDTTIAQVLADFAAGRLEAKTYTATFNPGAPVPEPATLGMISAGLLLMGKLARRRKA